MSAALLLLILGAYPVKLPPRPPSAPMAMPKRPLPAKLPMQPKLPPPAALQEAAQHNNERWAVILYEDIKMGGGKLQFNDSRDSLVTSQFNDLASSFKIIVGAKVRFYEDVGFKGAYFTFNCPHPIGNVGQGPYCEVANLVTQVETGWLCAFRPGGKECQGWWNDRISSVELLGPADEHEPEGVVDSGHR